METIKVLVTDDDSSMLLLETMLDVGYGASDFAGDKGLTAAGRLVIEQNAAGSVEPITLPVVDGDVVPKDLCTSVGTARVKGRDLVLGRRGTAEHFTGGGLVEAALHTGASCSFQQPECAGGDDVGRKLGDLETYLDVALAPRL